MKRQLTILSLTICILTLTLGGHAFADESREVRSEMRSFHARHVLRYALLDFEETVEAFAKSTLNKSEDQETLGHRKAFIVSWLRDEWVTLLNRDKTVEMTFNERTYLERLVATSKKLPAEEAEALSAELKDDLLKILEETRSKTKQGYSNTRVESQNGEALKAKAQELVDSL